jgi:hypothetical protein
MATAVETPYREHDHVTFHGHEADADPTAATASRPSMFPVGGVNTAPTTTGSQSIPMTTATDTSSRRPSFEDVSVAKPGLPVVPRSPSDSALIWTNYTLGFLGFLSLTTWLILLLIAQGTNFHPALKDSYTIALIPFLEMAPFFFAGMGTVIYAAQRNTAASWLVLTVYNLAISCFWLVLIVPYYVNLAFPGEVNSSCPDNAGDPLNPSVNDDNTNMCRYRKGAAALSCAVAFIHFLWFVIGLLQTFHHWNFANPVNQWGYYTRSHGMRKLWNIMIGVELFGYIIWLAGNLNLVEQSRNRVVTLSDPILIQATYFLSLILIASVTLTAYCSVKPVPSKSMYGATLMAHVCATMMYWAVFVWDARGATTPSIWLGNNAADVSTKTNKAIAAGIGIITCIETLFTVIFLAAYCMKWDDRKDIAAGDPAYGQAPRGSTAEERRYTGRV